MIRGLQIEGKHGKEFAKIESQLAEAKHRPRTLQLDFQSANAEVAELDREMIELEGRKLAGQVDEKALRQKAEQLAKARERASDDRSREIRVAASAVQAHEQRWVEYLAANFKEVRPELRKRVEQTYHGVGNAIQALPISVAAHSEAERVYVETCRLLGLEPDKLPRLSQRPTDLSREAARVIEAVAA